MGNENKYKHQLYLREANNSDCDLLFKWANDEITRKNSFNTEQIEYDHYVKWFDSLLADENRKQYILMSDVVPLGQVRFDFDGELAEIGYSIDEFNRGLGYGKSIIALAVNELMLSYPNIKRVIAKVKPSNVASIHCFFDNGFAADFNQYSFDMTNSIGSLEVPHNLGNEANGVLFLSNNISSFGLYEWIASRTNAFFYSGVLTEELLSRVNPRIVISYNYSHIVSEKCINAIEGRIINMHISYLPWNRGASPNFWSFVDDTPKGVTIHMLEAGLDKGDILFQKEIKFDVEKESFVSAYERLNKEICDLFKEHWDDLETGKYLSLRRKPEGKGSYHSVKDLKEIQSRIDFNWNDNISIFLRRYKEAEGLNI